MPRGPYQRSQGIRLSILEAIRNYPGTSRSELTRMTGRSWGGMAHHVRGLKERGEIQAHAIGRRQYYYCPGVSPSFVTLARLLRTEPWAIELLRVLNSDGPQSIKGLSLQVAADPKTVRRQLDRFAEAGLVGPAATWQIRFELRSIPLDFRLGISKGAVPPPPLTHGQTWHPQFSPSRAP